jgi:hypothetical protein
MRIKSTLSIAESTDRVGLVLKVLAGLGDGGKLRHSPPELTLNRRLQRPPQVAASLFPPTRDSGRMASHKNRTM